MRVCLFVPSGHLLGKDWPLGSRLWYITVSLSLSHWYPGSGVVLDCIDSLLTYLLFLTIAMYHHEETNNLIKLTTMMKQRKGLTTHR